MLGYVHLTAGRPVLERRAAAGMTYWALEGDLDGGLFPGRRLRRWIGRLERCGVSHAALPPGREGDFAPLRPVLPDGLRLALLPQLLDALAPAGDTALLLADCADSRALLAAQILARRFRRLRLETGAGQEALERQLLRQLGLTTGGGAAAVTVTFGPPPREGLPLYLTPDCALRQEVRYAWPDPSQAPPPEGLLSLLHRACRLPEICVKSVETLDRSRENHYNAT